MAYSKPSTKMKKLGSKLIDTHEEQIIVGAKTFNQLTASMGISSNGPVEAPSFHGDGSQLTGMQYVTPAGNTGELQFNNDGQFSSTDKVVFNKETLSVAGKIVTNTVVADEVLGDGSGLINVSVEAENIAGMIKAEQINTQGAIQSVNGNLEVVLSERSGLVVKEGALGVSLSNFNHTKYSDSLSVLVANSMNSNFKLSFQTIEEHIKANASKLKGTIPNSILPKIIYANAFVGDGSQLVNVTAEPVPTGENSEVQFNLNGTFGSTANFAYLADSNMLKVHGTVNASTAVRTNEVHLNSMIIGGDIIVDTNKNFNVTRVRCDEAYVNQNLMVIEDVIANRFIGDGSQLSGLPVQSFENYKENSVLFCGASEGRIKSLPAITFEDPRLSMNTDVKITGNLIIEKEVQFGISPTKPKSQDMVNGSAQFYLDETNSDLRIKIKLSDGTIKEGSIWVD
jgi:hypothetical protein